jgi:hypothetical protein
LQAPLTHLLRSATFDGRRLDAAEGDWWISRPRVVVPRSVSQLDTVFFIEHKELPMFARQKNRLVPILALATLVAFGLLGVKTSSAADLAKLDTSLKLIPADAAFYSSLLRNREQVEAIKNSKAWAKLMELPVVQMGLAMYNMQVQTPGTGPANFEEALNNPETRKIIDLAVDMASDEVFVYGDKNFVDFVELFQTVNTAQSLGPVLAQIDAKGEGVDPHKAQVGAILSALAQNPKLINIPNLVLGFKLKNTELAKEQLIKLETIANIMLESNEKTKGHFKKTKVAGHECLVLQLDGSMIPWDDVPTDEVKEAEAKEGDAQKVIDRVKEMKLAVAIGVRGNYLVVSIGSSLEALEKLEKGDRLIDRAELKPLANYADKRLLSIGYASEAINRQLGDQKKTIDAVEKVVDQMLPQAPLTDDQKARIRKDAKALIADVKTMLPKPGAAMGLSFLADHGIEGYQYSWGEHKDLDASQSLGLLEHVGGSPIFGLVVRQKMDVANYDMLCKWAKVGYAYFKELGLPAIPEPDRAKTEKFLANAIPLVERWDKANREMLFPALADGQLALVVDAKLTSDHFLKAAPATEKPMPMLEPALVLGVSNAELLKKGFGEYRAIVNGLIDAVRQIEGTNVPKEAKIPDPQVTESTGAKVYSFPLPAEWGVDKKIVPNVGVSDKVAVMTFSHDHTARLLKATPLDVGGVLGKADHPLAAAAWFRWAGLLEAADPWIDFAVDQATNANKEEPEGKKVVGDQVHTVVGALKTLQTITAQSYLQDGALVSHSLLEIHDLPK